MYIFTVVDDVKKVIEGLRNQYGEFTLAMLYSSGTLQAGANWNLIVSAPWTDRMGIAHATRAITNALDQGLELQDKLAISRVSVLKTKDPFVRDMTRLYDVGSPLDTPVQMPAGEITEGSAFILYSKRAA